MKAQPSTVRTDRLPDRALFTLIADGRAATFTMAVHPYDDAGFLEMFGGALQSNTGAAYFQ